MKDEKCDNNMFRDGRYIQIIILEMCQSSKKQQSSNDLDTTSTKSQSDKIHKTWEGQYTKRCVVCIHIQQAYIIVHYIKH